MNVALDAAPPSVQLSPLPAEFDLDFYLTENDDLIARDLNSAHSHFTHHGRSEGRAGTSYCYRNSFLSLLDPSHDTLEIGPFCSPCVRGPRVRYFDVLGRDALIERANTLHYSYSDPPEIDYVSSVGDLGIVTEPFAQVVSSHCVEHQPDLVRHLQAVERILAPGGRYFLIVPDKRFCFDHFIPTSSIADVVGAYCDKRVRHAAADVLEHESMTTHNDQVRHWLGDHGEPFWAQPGGVDRLRRTMQTFEASRNGYIDTHAWQFTPESFKSLINDLALLDLTRLTASRVYNTPRLSVEFCAVLEKGSD
ncbi:hypothetical protein [Methylorubrum extorquens]|uniref:Methyltransferase type 11 domain-containing protein n=1 Tax=Methylorubrum extorquens (strain CM4 / NCIMB 13688) TaxID=440085 RepID=B7KYP7_METC4|nr:hypothetical protein [Methylorubrum extorquens]ACK84798.1 hypothetical protein Mchl_3993 [Methylorubrum extorquens CM4]